MSNHKYLLDNYYNPSYLASLGRASVEFPRDIYLDYRIPFKNECLRKLDIRNGNQIFEIIPTGTRRKWSGWLIWGVILLVLVLVGCIAFMLMFISKEIDLSAIAILGILVLLLLLALICLLIHFLKYKKK